MSKPYTFSVTIMDTEEERKEPLSEQQLKDTLWASIEYRGTLTVLNIVRDYQVGDFGTYLVLSGRNPTT